MNRLSLLRMGFCAVGLLIGCDAPESEQPEVSTPAATLAPIAIEFVGSQECIRCHPAEGEAWRGSDHDRAMQETSTSTILGRFDGTGVSRDDEVWRFLRDGEEFVAELERSGRPIERLRIAYTFGVQPLQQYLVARPGGRFQALPIAWDARSAELGGQRWFDLQPGMRVPPGDPLHWDGLAYNWNSQCAACHSTRFAKGYDPKRDHFESSWAEIDVACEACHGPGSGHVARRDAAIDAPPGTPDLEVAFEAWNPDQWQRSAGARIATRRTQRRRDVQLEVCAPCHSRRNQLVDPAAVGAAFLDGHRPALLEPDLYFDDGQIREEVYVWGSFLQSRMQAAGVRCNDCHDPHSLRLRREGNALCTGCHDAAAYDATAHHGHVAETPGAACVACHMPERVYMEIDARRDHSFTVPRPERTASLGVPNACAGCHGDREPGWAARAIDAWRTVDGPAIAHWSDHLIDGDRPREDAGRWVEIALDAGLPPIVRANAWSRYAGEADDAEIAASADHFRELLESASELERMALIEIGRRLDPERRASLLRPLLEDARLAVRVGAAEALADLPASVWRPADRAVLARALGEHRARLLASAERPDAQVALGTLAVHYGEPDRARAAYRRAIELAPYFVPAYVNLADLERMQGRNAESLEWLGRAIAWAPDDPMVRYAYGLALHRVGQSAAALAELERAAGAAPNEPQLVLAWALSLDAAGRGGEAIEVLGDAIDRGVRSGDLRHALVTLLRDAGQRDRARARAESWQQASPGDPRPPALLRELEAVR